MTAHERAAWNRRCEGRYTYVRPKRVRKKMTCSNCGNGNVVTGYEKKHFQRNPECEKAGAEFELNQ